MPRYFYSLAEIPVGADEVAAILIEQARVGGDFDAQLRDIEFSGIAPKVIREVRLFDGVRIGSTVARSLIVDLLQEDTSFWCRVEFSNFALEVMFDGALIIDTQRELAFMEGELGSGRDWLPSQSMNQGRLPSESWNLAAFWKKLVG
ncbi:hypothetical protein ABZ958_38050 [Streptomyces sp. NPDC046237]|uniref:hypothetical protein n=1 Tax=Streptomyces sp. NPDC046237 TaxID=3154914 RepID=UPI00340C177D